MKNKIIGILLMAASLVAISSCQKDKPLGAIVNDDSTVTFRYSFDADSVSVSIYEKTYSMTGDRKGIWETTTDSLPAGFHLFNLMVDGEPYLDETGTLYHGSRSLLNAVEIPDSSVDFYLEKDVPHGNLSLDRYWSEYEQEWRNCYVYTPPQYDQSSSAYYPVVYIQHGGGEDHNGWVEMGKMNNIMDNLIAEGKCQPMILVAPNSVLQSHGTATPAGYNKAGMEPYKEELFNCVMPYIKQNYRILEGPENTAMCGLSMGGGQTFYIGLNNPDKFSYIGIFSTGLFGGIKEATHVDFENEVPGIFSATARFNEEFKVLYVTCGQQDPRVEPTTNAVKELEDHGVDVEFETFPGMHEWQVWRYSLREFAQKIFR